MIDTASLPIQIRGLSRRFGSTAALLDVSLSVRRGEIHALLGPNGAGKTTLLRILAGLATPSEGTASIQGIDVARHFFALRSCLGVIPSGERTFYMRLSGLENLVFFGQLYGLTRRQAVTRAREVLEEVGLAGHADLAVGKYSQGMQKRLAIARALAPRPGVLLVDEATQNLDPEGARTVRELIRLAADRGSGVLWATQRIEEIRGFADTVTLLHKGEVRFSGTPAQLATMAMPQSFLLRVRNDGDSANHSADGLGHVLGSLGALRPDGSGDGEHYVLTMKDGATLGQAIAVLNAANLQVLSCHETRSEVEQAFLLLTQGHPS